MANDAAVTGWSIDSRTLNAGDLYFALRGEVHDGHDFVADAFKKGAVAAVVDHEVHAQGLQLPVADTLAALAADGDRRTRNGGAAR